VIVESGGPSTGRSRGATGRRRVIDFVIGTSNSGWSGEIRALLERRLKVIAVVTAATMAAFLINGHLVTRVAARMTAYENGTMAAAAGWQIVVSILLFARRSPSLRFLRALEASAVASLSVSLFCWCYGWMAHGAAIAAVAPPEIEAAVRGSPWALGPGHDGTVLYVGTAGAVLAGRNTSTWALFVVGYGVVVPNTWRRCAAIVGLIAAMPLAAEAAAAASQPAIRPVLGAMLFQTGYLMAAFASIGVYGCYKLDTLRRAEFDARQVGQYRLVREIGRGGMGEVYLAEHRHLRRPCAVKIIRPGRTEDRHVARFEREVQSMARLTHPNTVEIYDYGRSDDGVFFYAMEYLPGLTLEQLVERAGPLPAGRVIHLLRQACGALAEAHGLGLIHRDVKPANLLVCERGGVHDVVKILDFGIVQDRSMPEAQRAAADVAGDGAAPDVPGTERLTQGGSFIGTPAYVSPEQIASSEADGRSDLYGLGGVAFLLLTGSAPFAGASAFELCMAHLTQTARLPSEIVASVPPDLDAVVAQCLAKDPGDRFQSARELDAALAACADAAAWSTEHAAAWWADAVSRGQVEAARSVRTSQTRAVASAQTTRVETPVARR